MNTTLPTTERTVSDRYAKAAQSSEPALCCAVKYNPELLKAIPAEVIERDYGCGDPSRYLRPGETVLDLGSGTGKICFIASQVVGPSGRVIGIDMTDEMLNVARRNAPIFEKNVGYSNVEFRKGLIQDLELDLDRLKSHLETHPVNTPEQWIETGRFIEQLRNEHPLVPADSIDTVVSNCVLNLVDATSKLRLFGEIFRVLKKGGRAVISDIVSDRVVPDEMQKDPELWSGCISGAFTEPSFLDAFTAAGFTWIQVIDRAAEPWRVVNGIEFRSITVEAFKTAPLNPLPTPCCDDRCC